MPIKTRDGRWLLVYNGMATGRVGFPKDQYSVGQMLTDPSGSFRPRLNTSQTVGCAGSPYQPALKDGPVVRVEEPFLVPEASDEVQGQVDQVVFAEGLMQFMGRGLVYYGQADS